MSILASRLKNATVHDVMCLNKLIAHIKNTAQTQQPLVLHRFDNDKMILIGASEVAALTENPLAKKLMFPWTPSRERG